MSYVWESISAFSTSHLFQMRDKNRCHQKIVDIKKLMKWSHYETRCNIKYQKYFCGMKISIFLSWTFLPTAIKLESFCSLLLFHNCIVAKRVKVSTDQLFTHKISTKNARFTPFPNLRQNSVNAFEIKYFYTTNDATSTGVTSTRATGTGATSTGATNTGATSIDAASTGATSTGTTVLELRCYL